MSGDRITTVAQLEALYGVPAQPSVIKETDRLTPAYRALIEASPFVVLASAGAQGLDCSPRGDAAGFVRVADENTLLLPDRRGNNRIDTLRNVVVDPRVALLVMVPGHGETLRDQWARRNQRRARSAEEFRRRRQIAAKRARHRNRARLLPVRACCDAIAIVERGTGEQRASKRGRNVAAGER